MKFFEMTVNHFLDRKSSIGKSFEFIKEQESMSISSNTKITDGERLRRTESPTKRLICKHAFDCIYLYYRDEECFTFASSTFKTIDRTNDKLLN
jgi:hypothetical protein